MSYKEMVEDEAVFQEEISRLREQQFTLKAVLVDIETKLKDSIHAETVLLRDRIHYLEKKEKENDKS